MDFFNTTLSYYSDWLGKREILHEDFSGTKFIYSPERNKIPCGYTEPFDLYGFYRQDSILFSYGDSCVGEIDVLKRRVSSAIPLETLKRIIAEVFGCDCSQSVKYVFRALPQGSCRSKPLAASDYPEYLEFFGKIHPSCKNTDWLHEYFVQMVNERLCCGLFEDDVLVSCTDAPDMPFMNDRVQEIGINTLESYRNHGYAADACTVCAGEIIKGGRCPQWSASADNIASQKLAEKAGFEKLADVLTITIPRTRG